MLNLSFCDLKNNKNELEEITIILMFSAENKTIENLYTLYANICKIYANQ